jgi:hypothetical protein
MRVLMLATWLTLGPSVTNAADRCASDDLAIKACVKQDLIDNNNIINGTLVDPGLQKTGSSGNRVDESNGKCGLKPHGYWVFEVS